MDLSTRYMGLALANPFVASASPLSQDVGVIRQLEDHGAAAVVLFSLFEERMSDSSRSGPTRAAVEWGDLAPAAGADPLAYLDLIRRATDAVDIPIIASLNGTTRGEWTAVARDLEQAGARAIELNVYDIPADPRRSGAEVEQEYVDLLASVKAAATVPVAMKLGPFFSSFAHMAARLDAAGADALVLFNRVCEADFDIEHRVLVPSLHLSRPEEIRLPLLWIALLHGRVRASLAATGGVHTSIEAIKYLMAGADVVMTASALLHEGPPFISRLVADVAGWMTRHDYGSLAALRGVMSGHAAADPHAFVRGQYVRSLEGYKVTSRD